MTDIHCSRCGTLVAHVLDTHFGLLPSSSLCVACAHPALRWVVVVRA